MAAHLGEDEVGYGEHARAEPRGEVDVGDLLACEDAHGSVEAHGEALVVDGLHHEVQRVNLVPLHGELREVGHEDEQRFRVALAQEMRSLHAVDAGQPDVHEHEVPVLLESDEIERRSHPFDVRIDPVLIEIARNQRPQRLASGLVILDDQKSIHRLPRRPSFKAVGYTYGGTFRRLEQAADRVR